MGRSDRGSSALFGHARLERAQAIQPHAPGLAKAEVGIALPQCLFIVQHIQVGRGPVLWAHADHSLAHALVQQRIEMIDVKRFIPERGDVISPVECPLA